MQISTRKTLKPPQVSKRGSNRLDPWLLSAAALLAVLATGSFLLRATDLHLPACSEPYDAAIYPWNFFWFREAFGAGDGGLLFTRRFFYPAGEGLALYTPTYVYGLLSLPLQWLRGTPAGLNLAVAAFLALSSAATAALTYCLARRMALGPVGAFLCALLFTFCAGRMMNAARLNLFGTEFLIALFLLAHAFWRGGGHRRAVWLGLGAATLLYQSQPLFYQATLALSVAALILGVSALRARLRGQDPDRPAPRSPSRAAPLLTAVACFALLTAPFLWRMTRDLASSAALQQSDRSLAIPDASLDLTSLLLPTPADALYGSRLGVRRMSFFEGQDPAYAVSFFLGLGWLLLVALALLRAPRRRWLPIAAGTGLVFAIALGPTVHLLFHPLPLPAPYALLDWFPLVRLSKSPVRLVLLVQLGLALLAGMGLDTLCAARSWRPAAYLVAATLGLLALLENSEALPLVSIQPAHRIPAEIADLARDPRSFSVLDLPLDGVPAPAHRVTAVAMALGAAHERPIFFGLYPRASRANFRESLLPTALCADLVAIGEWAQDPTGGEDPPRARDPGRVLAELAELDVGALIVHDPHDAPAWTRRQAEGIRRYLRGLAALDEQLLELGPGYDLALFRPPRGE